MEAQEKSLAEIRNRSMQLLQVILVAESIAFSVVLARDETIDAWIVAMLLSALAASLGVTVYIAHSISDWEIAGSMALGTKAYQDGIPLEGHLLRMTEEMERGREHNSVVLSRRFTVFVRLLYFLVALLAAAVITFLATR
ncbi:hypothetical protein ACFWBR_37885 [Streptomyces sp. NPDC060006]|uniref:hypothetical protein n=1 Tax=unclassified Streptomyces TaxID=2593676 RepID=UPI0036BBFF84